MNEAKERSTAAGGGVSFFGLLTILFVALKLTGYIAWSWWWVLSPLWLPAVVGVVLFVVCCLVLAIAHLMTTKR